MKVIYVLSFILLFFSPYTFSQTNVLPDIQLTLWASGLDNPVGIEHAGDGRLLIVEQTGRIRILDSNGNFKSQFLNISNKITYEGFEQGLLGLAFDPDYADNGYFYVHYTNKEGNNQFSRFSVNPNNPNKAM